MICLSCTGKTLLENVKTINKNKKFIDIVEIRSDFLDNSEFNNLYKFPLLTDLPCILSFRLPEDGGSSSIPSKERDDILISSLNRGWAFIDIEDTINTKSEKKLVDKAGANNVRIIKSFHNFYSTPKDLVERMVKNSCNGKYIPKAAVMLKSSKDLIYIFKAHQKIALSNKNDVNESQACLINEYILLGMGNYGLPSRIMAGAWGSMLTYCSEGKSAAPGHISPKELYSLYNYKNISPKTKIFGIIGKPVLHSKSPKIHNKKFKQEKIDCVYLPFETSNPEVIINNAPLLNIHGLSVTSPYKQRVIDYLDFKDEAVAYTKACNTMIKQDGWKGSNTDWKGFLKPIEKEFEKEGLLNKKRALVIGAGGAARAVVYALKKKNVDIIIANRSVKKAEILANEFNCKFTTLENLYKQKKIYDLVVQTTIVGMEPDIHKTPIPDFDFRGVKIAYDLIYAPQKTKFLKDAESAGCQILNGVDMLKFQALEQFNIFNS